MESASLMSLPKIEVFEQDNAIIIQETGSEEAYRLEALSGMGLTIGLDLKTVIEQIKEFSDQDKWEFFERLKKGVFLLEINKIDTGDVEINYGIVQGTLDAAGQQTFEQMLETMKRTKKLMHRADFHTALDEGLKEKGLSKTGVTINWSVSRIKAAPYSLSGVLKSPEPGPAFFAAGVSALSPLSKVKPAVQMRYEEIIKQTEAEMHALKEQREQLDLQAADALPHLFKIDQQILLQKNQLDVQAIEAQIQVLREEQAAIDPAHPDRYEEMEQRLAMQEQLLASQQAEGEKIQQEVRIYTESENRKHSVLVKRNRVLKTTRENPLGTPKKQELHKQILEMSLEEEKERLKNLRVGNEEFTLILTKRQLMIRDRDLEVKGLRMHVAVLEMEKQTARGEKKAQLTAELQEFRQKLKESEAALQQAEADYAFLRPPKTEEQRALDRAAQEQADIRREKLMQRAREDGKKAQEEQQKQIEAVLRKQATETNAQKADERRVQRLKDLPGSDLPGSPYQDYIEEQRLKSLSGSEKSGSKYQLFMEQKRLRAEKQRLKEERGVEHPEYQAFIETHPELAEQPFIVKTGFEKVQKKNK